MTNTKFRKRALLSSVAMLLVALVALGSATFAWFSTTNTATASSMLAKTDKASNILLSETGDGGWTTDLHFTRNTSQNSASLKPVTTADFSTWNQTEAVGYDLGYATQAYTPVSNIKGNGTYAKYTTLFIQNNGDTAAVQIVPSITYNNPQPSQGVDDTTGENYLRVALVPLAVASSNATAIVSGTGAGNKVFGDANDRANITTAPAGWSAANQDTADSPCTGALTTNQSLGSLTQGEIYGYDVYVYYEGTDFDCKDSVSGGNLSVTFNVSLAS